MTRGLRRRALLTGAGAIMVGFALSGAGIAAAAGQKLPGDLPISFGGPFSLTDHEGMARTERDFRGRFMLIYFGYTHCPDLCPTGLQTISEALDAIGSEAARIQPLFVSVDPARDTVELLRDYMGHFHPSLIGLTGTERQVRAVAKAYRIHRLKVVPEGATDPSDYLVTHSTITYLMGPDGKFVTLFPHDTQAAFMAKTLRKYVAAES